MRPATNSPAIGRVTAPLAEVDIRGLPRGPLPHDSGAVEMDASAAVTATVRGNGIALGVPRYLDALRIFFSDDLVTWTEFPANASLTISSTNSYRFYKARFD